MVELNLQKAGTATASGSLTSAAIWQRVADRVGDPTAAAFRDLLQRWHKPHSMLEYFAAGRYWGLKVNDSEGHMTGGPYSSLVGFWTIADGDPVRLATVTPQTHGLAEEAFIEMMALHPPAPHELGAVVDLFEVMMDEQFVHLLRTPADAAKLRETPQLMIPGEPAPESSIARFRPPYEEEAVLVFMANRRFPGELLEYRVTTATGAATRTVVGRGQRGARGKGRPVLDAARVPVIARASKPAGSIEAASWISNAELEHSSVATFAQLTLDLMRFGAPLDLLEGALKAALEEVSHARLCLDMAERCDGQRRVFGPLVLPEPVWPDLATLARDAHVEGVLGEGQAAEDAAASAATATDPVERRVYEQIAREEATHAELAARIIAFVRREQEETMTEQDDTKSVSQPGLTH